MNPEGSTPEVQLSLGELPELTEHAPTESAEKVLDTREAKDQAVLETEKAERGLFDKARDVVADYYRALKKGKTKALPWVLAGLVAVQSWSVESSLAKEADSDIDRPMTTDIDNADLDVVAGEAQTETETEAVIAPDLKNIPERTKNVLKKLEEHDGWIRIAPEGHPVYDAIKEDAEDIDEPIILEEGAEMITVGRTIEGETFVAPPGATGKTPSLRGRDCVALDLEGRELIEGDNKDRKFGCWRQVDQHGNSVQVFRVQTDGGMEERVMIIPKKVELADGKPPEARSIDIDLTAIGLGEIEGAIYQPQLIKLGSAEMPLASSQKDLRDNQDFLREHGQDIEQGISAAAGKFGLHPKDIMQHVKLEPDGADKFNIFQRTMILGRIFDKDMSEDGKQANSGHFLMKTVAAHETNHAVDAHLGISGRVLEDFSQPFADAFFALGKSARDFNESRYFSGDLPLGHASDSPSELFASIINTLDYQDWEKMLRKSGDENRAGYVDALKAAQKTLEDVVCQTPEKLSLDAPIFKQLKDRIAAVEAMPMDTVAAKVK